MNGHTYSVVDQHERNQQQSRRHDNQHHCHRTDSAVDIPGNIGLHLDIIDRRHLLEPCCNGLKTVGRAPSTFHLQIIFRLKRKQIGQLLIAELRLPLGIDLGSRHIFQSTGVGCVLESLRESVGSTVAGELVDNNHHSHSCTQICRNTLCHKACQSHNAEDHEHHRNADRGHNLRSAGVAVMMLTGIISVWIHTISGNIVQKYENFAECSPYSPFFSQKCNLEFCRTCQTRPTSPTSRPTRVCII